MGTSTNRQRARHRRCPDYAALAHPPGTAPEGVFAPSCDVVRRNPSADTGHLGSFLCAAANLAALARSTFVEGTARLPPCLQALSADVCQYRDRDRFGTRRALGQDRPMAGRALPSTVRRNADARPADS